MTMTSGKYKQIKELGLLNEVYCHVPRCTRQATDTHEIIGRGAYARVKVGYEQVGNQWELCHEHHMECHKIGAVSFADKYDLRGEYINAKGLFNEWNTARYHSVKQIK